MSAAKMVILQPDAWIAAVSAVLAVMSDLRRTIGGSPVAPEFMDYLREQMAANTEALNALNATTVTATAVMASDAARGTLADLDGTNLSTVIFALHFMLHVQNSPPFALVTDMLHNQVICRPDDLNAALLFLENPK